MSDDLSREEVYQAIDHAVGELLAGAGIGQPPVDASALAREHFGLVPGKARPGRKPAAPGPDAPPEQRHWLAALEVAAHLKPGLLARLGVEGESGPPTTGESLTTCFAQRLLVPTPWLADLARSSGFDLFTLKQRFATASLEAIAWRLLDLGEPCVITVVENGHVSRRRSNAWAVNRSLSEAEQECQRQVHRYSRPGHVRRDGWSAWGWPVHAADWRREVLRAVAEE